MNIAIVLSGGKGTRLSSEVPKQYIKVADKMIISYCLETLIGHEFIDAVLIVADEGWRDVISSELDELGIHQEKVIGFSSPGATRQLSILNGLRDIKTYIGNKEAIEYQKIGILVHDAARPCLSKKLITECLHSLKNHDGVMPVLPMKDTVYLSNDGKAVSQLLEREKIFAGQAPEAFWLDSYYQANERLLPDKILRINGSTEPAILAGLDIAIIDGSEENFKITTREDLKKFQKIIETK